MVVCALFNVMNRMIDGLGIRMANLNGRCWLTAVADRLLHAEPGPLVTFPVVTADRPHTHGHLSPLCPPSAGARRVSRR